MKQHSGQELNPASASEKKVLITGIDGFTGKYLEKKLVELGFDVFGTVIADPANPDHSVCDIRDLKSITSVIKEVQPDFVIHLAAISFVGTNNVGLMHDVNVNGTANLLRSIVDSGLNPQKIIIAGSATVYGNQNSSVLDETMLPQPVNDYGFSKYEAEKIAASYFDKLNIIVTRPFNYTGPGQAEPFLIPKIVNHFRQSASCIELGNIQVAREFNHVDDVCNVYVRLMLSNAKSVVVNVCSGREVYLNDILAILNKMAGYEIEVRVNQSFVRENEIFVLKGSNNLLNSLISYSFQKDIGITLHEMFFVDDNS